METGDRGTIDRKSTILSCLSSFVLPSSLFPPSPFSRLLSSYISLSSIAAVVKSEEFKKLRK